MNTTNTMNLTGFDLNAIISAAVLQVITTATAPMAARIDELERVASAQADTIEALLRGLKRVEGVVDGAQPMQRSDDDIARRVGVIESTLYACVASDAPEARAVPVALMQDVAREVKAAMDAHTDAYDHDEFGPAMAEDELDRTIERAIDRAIDAHNDDDDHLGASDIEEAIDKHEALYDHDDIKPPLDDDEMRDMVRRVIRDGDITVRLSVE